MVEIESVISIFTTNVNGLNVLGKEKDEFSSSFKEKKMEDHKTFRLKI